ncbi:MAG: hypothetical protein ACOYK8_06040 [Alphaproteobacteria bacterium]
MGSYVPPTTAEAAKSETDLYQPVDLGGRSSDPFTGKFKGDGAADNASSESAAADAGAAPGVKMDANGGFVDASGQATDLTGRNDDGISNLAEEQIQADLAGDKAAADYANNINQQIEADRAGDEASVLQNSNAPQNPSDIILPAAGSEEPAPDMVDKITAFAIPAIAVAALAESDLDIRAGLDNVLVGADGQEAPLQNIAASLNNLLGMEGQENTPVVPLLQPQNGMIEAVGEGQTIVHEGDLLVNSGNIGKGADITINNGSLVAQGGDIGDGVKINMQSTDGVKRDLVLDNVTGDNVSIAADNTRMNIAASGDGLLIDGKANTIDLAMPEGEGHLLEIHNEGGTVQITGGGEGGYVNLSNCSINATNTGANLTAVMKDCNSTLASVGANTYSYNSGANATATFTGDIGPNVSAIGVNGAEMKFTQIEGSIPDISGNNISINSPQEPKKANFNPPNPAAQPKRPSAGPSM